MKRDVRALVVTGDPAVVGAFVPVPPRDGLTTVTAEVVPSVGRALEVMGASYADVALIDLKVDAATTLDPLMRFRAATPGIPVVVLVGGEEEPFGVSALTAGAHDFLLRGQLEAPWIARVLRGAVDRYLTETALRLMESALRRSEADLDTTLGRCPDGLVVTDRVGRRLFANAVAEALWRSAGTELGEVPFGSSLVPGEARQLDLQSTGDRQTTVELRVVEGQWHTQPAFLVFLRDVTHRKRNEHQLQIASEKLKQTIRNLVDRNTEIQLFYHTLSHELKTPLASAREFVSIVMDGLAGPLNPTQLEYLGFARESCDQLGLYVNDLLDVTRLETGKMSIACEPAALEALADRVVQVLTPEATRRQLTLSWTAEPGLPRVSVDSQRIMQVLTNLITNALKFTPAGGRVHVHVSEAPGDSRSVQVAVSDTGRGISPDQQGLIFKRLHQVNESEVPAASRSGLGLGLYICRELVELHGGRIWVESRPGEGSSFKFTLPKEHQKTSVSALVVDDDAVIREALCGFLESESFQATAAAGGAEALELMRRQLPQVVVLDLQMPGMDGVETLRLIRREWSDIPVVISTGHPKGDLMERLAACAPFAVLEKPYLPNVLLNTIRALIR